MGTARRLPVALALVAATLAGMPAQAQEPPARTGADDATVVAVIDSGISPYHWDFLASKTPQALDEDPSNDLPLDQSPDTWLPGFPDPSTFASYTRMDLTLDHDNPGRPISALRGADAAQWSIVRRSTASAQHYHWFPGTKVIGGLTFAQNGRIEGTAGSHGHGTSSVSVGNLYGSCPECLLVFIQYGSRQDGEAAIEWAMSQPWIDAITNSYGFSLVMRDRLYSGSDTEAQAAASERGQTIFFSAGNGQANTFTAPNTTLFSSQEGPDWMVTVGAVSPSSGASYTGHGKPADIASVGLDYPASYGSSTVGGQGSGFGGTSNATPVIAGTYARGLYVARRALPGPSRIQDGGVVAVQNPDPALGEAPFACGEARPDCELGDGVLTASELRTRLFHGAVHTAAGMTASIEEVGETPPIGEDEFLNEGHGTYFARLGGDAEWLEEFDRLAGPLQGTGETLTRPAGERDWMIVDSYCRQELWGSWTGGYYVEGETTLPAPSPTAPIRSAWQNACPALFPPV